MITFNGINPKTYGVTVKDISRSVMPSFNNTTYSNRGGNGSTFVKRTIAERSTDVTLQIKSARTLAEVQEVASKVVCWLNVDEPKKLTFDDMPGKYLMAMPAGSVDLTQTYTYGVMDVSFVAFDPFMYDVNLTTVSLKGNSYFDNASTAETDWKLTLTLTAVSTGFTVVLGTSQMGFTGNYAIGDKIVITSKGIITINGVKDMHKLSLDSKINRLKGGKVLYNVPTGVTASIEYRNTYLY